jgi:putative heme iron utilization protein
MTDDEIHRLRRELSESFTEAQVAVLRVLRAELSTRRWQVMLEIDAAQEDLRSALRQPGSAEAARRLGSVQVRLQRAHEQLARIPEDVIPAF